MSALNRAELRDLAAMDGLAQEVLRQTEFLRLNMAEEDTHDRIRFGLIAHRTRWLVEVAERCERRAAKITAERRAVEAQP